MTTPTPPRRGCQVPDCPEAQHGHGLCHRHLEQWRYRCKKNPEVAADELRPDRERELQRERWVRAWLMEGNRAGIFHSEVCPWECEFRLRVSIPIITRILDVEGFRADWERYRERLLAVAEERGRPAWAARYFEG